MNDLYDSGYFMDRFFEKVNELAISEESKLTLIRLAGSINTTSFREGVNSAAKTIIRVKDDTGNTEYPWYKIKVGD